MKDKKGGKNTQKGKQPKQKPKELPGCLSFGKLDLIYKIEFTEKDLEKTEEEIQKDENGSKYRNIEDINTLTDLQFIKDKKNIWDKIILKPNNSTLEQLLTANRISKKKMVVEYITYGNPKFEGDEEYFLEIYNYINEKNNFDINETPLKEDGSYSLTFELQFKDQTHTFKIGTGGDDKEEENKDEKKKEENGNEQNQNEEKPKEENEENKEENKEEKKKEEEKVEPDEYEPNEAMKADKIPKFSRKDTVLCNLNPKQKKYSLFYLNFDDLKNIPGDFDKRDLIELLYFLKKKGSNIFINYYKPE